MMTLNFSELDSFCIKYYLYVDDNLIVEFSNLEVLGTVSLLAFQAFLFLFTKPNYTIPGFLGAI